MHPSCPVEEEVPQLPYRLIHARIRCHSTRADPSPELHESWCLGVNLHQSQDLKAIPIGGQVGL